LGSRSASAIAPFALLPLCTIVSASAWIRAVDKLDQHSCLLLPLRHLPQLAWDELFRHN
jgi:hypothetical protein